MSLTSLPRRLSRLSVLLASIVGVIGVGVPTVIAWIVTHQLWEHVLIVVIAAVAGGAIAARTAIVVLRFRTVGFVLEPWGRRE